MLLCLDLLSLWRPVTESNRPHPIDNRTASQMHNGASHLTYNSHCNGCANLGNMQKPQYFRVSHSGIDATKQEDLSICIET